MKAAKWVTTKGKRRRRKQIGTILCEERCIKLNFYIVNTPCMRHGVAMCAMSAMLQSTKANLNQLSFKFNRVEIKLWCLWPALCLVVLCRVLLIHHLYTYLLWVCVFFLFFFLCSSAIASFFLFICSVCVNGRADVVVVLVLVVSSGRLLASLIIYGTQHTKAQRKSNHVPNNTYASFLTQQIKSNHYKRLKII